MWTLSWKRKKKYKLTWPVLFQKKHRDDNLSSQPHWANVRLWLLNVLIGLSLLHRHEGFKSEDFAGPSSTSVQTVCPAFTLWLRGGLAVNAIYSFSVKSLTAGFVEKENPLCLVLNELLLNEQETTSQIPSQQTKLPDSVLIFAPEGRVKIDCYPNFESSLWVWRWGTHANMYVHV